MPTSISEFRKAILAAALAEGLPPPRITGANLPAMSGEHLEAFLAADRHGAMTWMEIRKEQRKSPDTLWPDARTAIVFAQPYGQNLDPLGRLQKRDSGTISVYALNRDYHDVFKGKLKRIAQSLHKNLQGDAKIFVDTAPLMEKPLAQQAGLGWQGKHTNLVSRDLGSWFFIGTILTTARIEPDRPETDHCGTCKACLDICPTNAFPAPRQLDARRCISYLTIEHEGHIAEEFRKPMGNRIYGCDDCLAVCPWNKFAEVAREAKLQAREELVSPKLEYLLKLDDAAFRKLFSASPVKRTGRDRFVRNCLIAAGNSGETSLVPVVRGLLRDASSVVRAMAIWALKQLTTATDFAQLRQEHELAETDATVKAEWQ